MIKSAEVKKTGKGIYTITWMGDTEVSIFLLDNQTKEAGKLLLATKEHVVQVTTVEYYRPYFVLKDHNSQITIATRVLPLEGANNFRDLGGYITKSKQRIKWGKLFRSDHLHRLTEYDQLVLNEIGLRTIIDYRRADEYSDQPNKSWEALKNTFHIIPEAERAVLAAKASNTKEKVQHLVNREVDSDVKFDNSGKTMIEQAKDFVRLEENKKSFKEMLGIVLDEKNVPIDQHCRGGKDRTGYGVALILYLLGIDMETIIQDFMLTKELRETRNQRRMDQYSNETNDQNILGYLYSMLDTRPEYLEASFDEMIKESGSIDNYFKSELNITEENIRQLRETYLE
ncbi:tyrosine-protein phosphatase [Tetragenococcus koreensis]|uniref:tyrosine-protein phosphatase n=1 Tax=Tetragenococcus koreensis TaxID=290335 RepID=UPI000F501891|nr:tyrosine-protein phosphatase [Tetragenococcus koreensis]AYW44829.1 protein-tyrosine-phosphatase [Tetragenococcus koreensis]GEN90400.1 protein-tyrosine-phosphatase [Tetragenococcus koreensis]